nr:polysaccharide deacetylase family protein [Sulfitobacter maritimus]
MALDAALAAQARGELERETVAITFDDGYRNNLTVAGPILERFGFPATLFVTTGFIDSEKLLWPNRILQAVQRTALTSLYWRDHDFPLVDKRDKSAANARLQAAAKSLSPQDPGAIAEEIEHALEVPVNPSTAPGTDFTMVSSAEIAAARHKGIFQFGAHTVTHPILSALDQKALETEIAGSVESLRRLNGGECVGFAYPNGRSQDFDARAIAILRKLGINHAVATNAQPNTAGSDAFRLGRFAIGASDTWSILRWKLRKASVKSRLSRLGSNRRRSQRHL